VKGRCSSAHSLSASKEAALASWRPLSFVVRVGRYACLDEGMTRAELLGHALGLIIPRRTTFAHNHRLYLARLSL